MGKDRDLILRYIEISVPIKKVSSITMGSHIMSCSKMFNDRAS
jgi:hypothetical protein